MSGVTCLSQIRQIVEFSQKDLSRGGGSWTRGRRFGLGEPHGPESRPVQSQKIGPVLAEWALKYLRSNCVCCPWTGVILRAVVGSLHSGVIWGHWGSEKNWSRESGNVVWVHVLSYTHGVALVKWVTFLRFCFPISEMRRFTGLLSGNIRAIYTKLTGMCHRGYGNTAKMGTVRRPQRTNTAIHGSYLRAPDQVDCLGHWKHCTSPSD